MLVQFSVANYRSIKEKQTLSMVSSSQKELEETNTFKPSESSKFSLVKSAVIYGANGAGKSNLIHALDAMRLIVVGDEISPAGSLPITPYRLSAESSQQPTEFEVISIIDGVRYQYGFSATQERIVSEWLMAYPNGKMQGWFSREYDATRGEYTWTLGSKLKGDKKKWQESTRQNALFLTMAARYYSSKQLTPIYEWFSWGRIWMLHKGTSVIVEGLLYNHAVRSCKGDLEFKKRVLDILKGADLDIHDLEVQTREPRSTPPSSWNEVLQEAFMETTRERVEYHPLSVHLDEEGKEVVFDFSEESDGTQRFFMLLLPWLKALEDGNIVVIDELHTHLHRLLAKHLIAMFHSPQVNKKNAQLIFTTHDTSLLDKELFRRDQVWFCEKNHGATTLYPLTDFQVRKKINLEKGYLSGRYGAVPIISDLSGLFTHFTQSK